ncbi:MAG: YbjN domain-containing protein [Propionibacteriaceae bacterium]|jgi:hypothetical protein|nr:YbjN domain-containing protein [Propionibacteriaceae bacterium]
MGYFTRPDGSLKTSDLAPLTTSRVTACLDSHEWHYEVNERGDIGGWWDGYWFIFAFRGQDKATFFPHAVWRRGVPASKIQTVRRYANEWNNDHLWPRVCVVKDDKSVMALADFAVDYSFGLTDEQLDLHIRCAIDTMVSAFQWLDGKFPEYASNEI